jgi:hypothetical protein
MPAQYVNVTHDDIAAFLSPQGFKKIVVPGAVEIVYGKRVDVEGKMMTLRVYTGINPDGDSRGCGEDAIRCTVFWRKEDGSVKMIGGSKRVHRVKGWKKNLQNRLNNFAEQLGPSCPQCASPMVLRDGKRGEFWGCADYPVCKATKPV